MEVLRAEEIYKTYNGTILDKVNKETKYNVINGISLSIQEGESVSIMGKSGCGKTTLLKILGTIDQPSGGKIYYNNENIGGYSDEKLSELRNKTLGFVFQDFNLINSMTVEENILVPMIIKKDKKIGIDEKFMDKLEQLGISNILKKYPSEISGGQKQRVAIARALANDPQIILADEPTGNLDSAAATNIIESLARVNKVHKKALVMVTHDPLVASYCDRILFLKDGNIIEEMNSSINQDETYKNIRDRIIKL